MGASYRCCWFIDFVKEAWPYLPRSVSLFGPHIKIIIIQWISLPLLSQENLFSYSQAMQTQSTECKPELMESEDDLFVMFTSGLTGEPKGVIHTQAGYLLHVAVTHKVRY